MSTEHKKDTKTQLLPLKKKDTSAPKKEPGSGNKALADALKSTIGTKPLGNRVGEFDSCTGYHIRGGTMNRIKEP